MRDGVSMRFVRRRWRLLACEGIAVPFCAVLAMCTEEKRHDEVILLPYFCIRRFISHSSGGAVFSLSSWSWNGFGV